MNYVKYVTVIFLALYLIIVGLAGLGVTLAFVPPAVVGFFALASGVVLLGWAVKSWYCGCCDGKCGK